ncbi:phosphate ABC transporter substrate-binding protein [Vibrio sp. 10N.286.49.C2]|uniref:phosphate ABC transporter substrate-binding protein n=1 Tax=unclassified Vibrio TaxID=2614977 RepID=UPI000C81990B|nr:MULTISPECIES: phosphate ABC transporter substrate-binding protein [unclassified Vibrio]PMH34787.1 phosphate ABC transporter substrate-binding protein [Vibrio sp. 10N.286.49.C2]PMH51425.1 phosphate ABC transporter substrate-binding protein [Vibrio sp. 10N.286.49.B1]PMH79380.1 phosphate ABC transporter substrate-binding protein [Vibrio sp. 10N.286.48.B7]
MLRVAMAALISLSATSFAYAEEVNISGSTSVARVMDVLAEHYNTDHKETFIAVQGIGSTAGITLVDKGVADIGMSSRYLTERESSDSLDVFPIAYDGLAIVVNITNPVPNLSREQVFDIYKGKITNWKQVGGEDKDIAVVTREASSGTRYSFESLLGLTRIVNDRLVSDINPTNLVVNSNSMVKTIVNHNPHAIGFISEGSVDRSIKAIQFEGVEASTANIAKGEYKLARPFLLLHKKDEIDDDADKFIKFVLSDNGQALIAEYGYTPIKK